MPFGVTTIQRPSCRLTGCTGPRPGNGAPARPDKCRRDFPRRRSRRGRRGWSSPAPPAAARAPGLPPRQRAAPGAACGSGVPGLGAVVCGAEIEPVTSALACSRRSEILAIWLCADLFACSRLAFSVVISLAEPGDRLLHRLVLFDGGDVGARGRRKIRRSPARRPRRRARPRSPPRRRARHSVCGAPSRASAAASRAPAARNRCDRAVSRLCPVQVAGDSVPGDSGGDSTVGSSLLAGAGLGRAISMFWCRLA